MDYALCIGIDNYLHLNKTACAENDAKVIAETLNLYHNVKNPIVLIGKYATHMNIETEINFLKEKISDSDRIFFFFAGHGKNILDLPHISCYDTNPRNTNSFFNLYDLMSCFNSHGCKKVIFFIDACESTIGIGHRITDYTKFSLNDLKINQEEVLYSCVFSATSHKGVADIIPEKNHGIWTYFLIEALSGKAESALTKDLRLTNNTLKNFLNIAVKKYTKQNPQVSIQNAATWGKEEAEFLIKQFEEQSIEKYDDLPPSVINNVAFESVIEKKITSFSGFKKGAHTKPKYYSQAVINFLDMISREDIKSHLEEVSQSIRKLINLRLKDYEIEYGTNSGTFTCPLFSYSYSLEINQEKPDEVKCYQYINTI